MWRISYKRKLSIITVANKNKRFLVYTRNNIWLSCWAAVKHLKLKHMSFWKALPWRISCQNVCHSKVWSTEDSLTKWANMRSLTYVRDDKQCHSDDHREEESLPQAIITWDSSYTLRMIERGNSSHSVYGLGSEWQTPLPRHKKEMNLYLINRNRL